MVLMLICSPQYSQALVTDSRVFGEAGVPFYLTDVDCTGTEVNLLDCSSTVLTPATAGQCNTRFEPAVVTCFDDVSSVDFRKYSNPYNKYLRP